jgi:cob(I)alamin adenosyltransferase
MKPNDIITLTAFLTALNQLDEPLPVHIQAQLNQIGKALAADPSNLGNLDAIAESYEPLDTVYQEELAALESEVGERNKNEPPLPLPNLPSKELANAAINSFSSDDSVFTAKQAAKPSILKQIWQSITGSK